MKTTVRHLRHLVPFAATWAALALAITGACAVLVALDTRRDKLDYVTIFHYLREYRERGTCGATYTGANGRCLPAVAATLERAADRFWPDVWAMALPPLVVMTAVVFAPPVIAAAYAATTRTRRAADARRQRRFTFAHAAGEGAAEEPPGDALPPLPPPPPGVRP